jgi:hypothetical protein
MNTLNPNHQLLEPTEYYVYPYWIDMEHLKKSKVIHFIGHEKPQEMIDIINKKITEYNI